MKKNSILKILINFIFAVIIVSAITYFGIDKDNSLFQNIFYNNDSAVKQSTIIENGEYTSLEDVSLYIHTYNKLPKNYITKKEAMNIGWNSSENDLSDIAKGKSIGGDKFGNFEKKLPNESGRKYYEADIDYKSGNRNSKRIIYSNDGLIYYTDDHYKTFKLIYDKDGKK